MLRQIYGIPLKWEPHTDRVVWGEAQAWSTGTEVHLTRKGIATALETPEPATMNEWTRWVNRYSPNARTVWRSQLPSLVIKSIWYALSTSSRGVGVSGAFPSASSVRPHRLPSVPPPLPRPRPVQLPRPLPALRLRTARVSGAFPSASSAHPHPLPSRPPPLPHPRPPRRREFVQLPHRRLPRLHASAGPLRALRLRTPRVAAPHLRHASPWPWYPWPCGCETTVKRWRTKCPPGITSSSGHNRSPLVLCVSIAHTCGQEFTRREYSFRCSLQYRHTFCA